MPHATKRQNVGHPRELTYIYETECWVPKTTHIHVTEMHMLHWMCSKIRKDRMTNEKVRSMLSVSIVYGGLNIYDEDIGALLRCVEWIYTWVPKKMCLEVIRKYSETKRLKLNEVLRW